MRLKRLMCVGLLAALAVCSCQKKSKNTTDFARVGNTTFTRADFDNFMKLRRLYPAQSGSAFPGERAPATFLVESVVLCRAAGWGGMGVSGTADWQWKKKYYPAQMYISEVLGQNLGASDKEIQSYYKAHKDSFMVTVKVAVKRDTAGLDSAAKASLRDSTRDSTAVRALEEVKDKIVEALFAKKFPPDSAFFSQSKSPTDSTIDTALTVQRWIREKRRDPVTFFMLKEFQAAYHKPYPDSLNDWYGEGKIITPADFKVIQGWLPADRREGYNNPSGTKYLAEWLLKWKLFAAAAQRTGYADRKDVKAILDWAKKVDIAASYVEKSILPRASKGISVDTAMAVFACWDERGTPGIKPDSASLADMVTKYLESERANAVDKVIYGMRKKAKVTFLQNDWKDLKDQDPVRMIAEADSQLAAGDSRKSEALYRDVRTNFPFSPEGLKSLTELAKIQTEKGSYRDAVKNYRQFLISSSDASKRCNTFFMIGFIYDEYLSKPELAEAQYRWILKNEPDCELADDAEFMSLHLDEPMTSVEELQAEARRQGRTIEETPVDSAVVDTPAAAPAK